jgi:organic radical activating enzyme
MASIVQQANNTFCPAPWVSMFYQVDKASVCCTSADKLKMSPKEFLKSDYLKKLRKDFIKGDKPNNCGNCWRNEEKNLLSIRQHFLNNFPEYTKDKFTEFADKPLEYVELRCSNQCNFMCRMCNPTNSVEIAREANKYPFAHNFHDLKEGNELNEISEKDWNEIISLTEDLRYLFLTGGEPLLMKQYYDLLDKLINNGKCEDIALHIYTNCSVYNPKFVEKITQFKNVKLNLSIDAVGKIAEYQRKGTNWEIVKENAYKLAALPNIKPIIHSTVTAYTVLDINALIDFYIETKEKFDNIRFQMHVANRPLGMAPNCLDERLRKIASEEIDKALVKLTDEKFKRIKKELIAINETLKLSPLKDFDRFYRLTKNYDAMRDESFEQVFGYKLAI